MEQTGALPSNSASYEQTYRRLLVVDEEDSSSDEEGVVDEEEGSTQSSTADWAPVRQDKNGLHPSEDETRTGFLSRCKGFSRISKWKCSQKLKIFAGVLAALIVAVGGVLALHYTIGLGNAWQHTVDFFKSKIVAWITLPTAAIGVAAGGAIGYVIGRKTAKSPSYLPYSYVPYEE